MGPRLINLTVTSLIGCLNSLTLQGTYRSIVVLPRQVLTPIPPATTGVYSQDFELSNGNWQVWGTGATALAMTQGTASSSWAYGAPPANIAGLISGAKIWKTNLTGNYNPGEKSAIYSPSLDLTSLTRPMISFSSIVQMEKSDGVVMEYSTDNLNIADPNKKWLALGVIGDGEDWFTDQGIAGRPGGQLANDYGWSGTINLPSNAPKWLSSKHTLNDMYPPKGARAPSKAVFRFALGSAAATVTTQGFALDNVRIGDRTRTILLESFVNTNNATLVNGKQIEHQEADSVILFQKNSVGTEVVKVNYHVSFPGRDPFNEDNVADPSSRALLYNIVTTPRSRLDGEADVQDRVFHNWVPPLYNLRTLKLAQADIDITPVTNPNGSISISVNVTSTVLTGIPSKTVLHVAILEQTIALSALSTTKQAMVKSGETTFDYTLKKMLPSAAGSSFGAILANGASRSFGPNVWTPDPTRLYQAPGDLAVAVFLQQEAAPYEVYQVELVKNLTEPSVVTGLEPIPAEQIVVYPSPANHEMNIMLPGVLAQPAALQMIDQVGRVTMDAVIPQGANSKTINTRDLSAGIYILQIDTGNGNFTRKKVMVIHE